MTDTLLTAIVLVASIIIALRSEPELNRMSPCAPLLVRMAFHMLTLGAVAQIAAILAWDDTPNWPEAITAAGITALLISDRLAKLRARVAGRQGG